MESSGGILRQLCRELFSRVGFGTLLITIGGAVSLGMVPNIVETVAGQRILVFIGIFVLAVLVVFAGWWTRRDRGVGVVVWLMPGTGSLHRLTDSIKDAGARHGTFFAVQRDRLWPDHRRLPALRDRVDVAHWQIQDRLNDCVSGAVSSTHASFYVHARLPEAFALGRRMTNDSYGRLDVMHFSHRAGSSFVKVLELDNRLARSTDVADRRAIEPWLTAASMRAEVQQHDDVSEDYRHRLMLIVNLTRNTNVLAAARQVARTGEVVGPDGRPQRLLLRRGRSPRTWSALQGICGDRDYWLRLVRVNLCEASDGCGWAAVSVWCEICGWGRAAPCGTSAP
ncbi:hypothetical protein [Streptomyces ardesiacus]|uniref:hypothetical protein n=1 Tax=Streptomyces ardesiacus TaxID=285564 RepID=UPI00365EB6F8